MVVLLFGSPMLAQGVSASTLKAAFLFNFVKFTEWPADTVSPDMPLTLCVLGDDVVQAELEKTVKGQRVGEHSLIVVRVNIDGALRSCHVLYVTGLDRRRSLPLIARINGAAVLTVSDANEFAALGGVAQLFVESGKMRFAINPSSALRARLRISSKLFALAKLVKDGTDGPVQ